MSTEVSVDEPGDEVLVGAASQGRDANEHGDLDRGEPGNVVDNHAPERGWAGGRDRVRRCRADGGGREDDALARRRARAEGRDLDDLPVTDERQCRRPGRAPRRFTPVERPLRPQRRKDQDVDNGTAAGRDHAAGLPRGATRSDHASTRVELELAPDVRAFRWRRARGGWGAATCAARSVGRCRQACRGHRHDEDGPPPYRGPRKRRSMPPGSPYPRCRFRQSRRRRPPRRPPPARRRRSGRLAPSCASNRRGHASSSE